jgi:hypothetical protein
MTSFFSSSLFFLFKSLRFSSLSLFKHTDTTFVRLTIYIYIILNVSCFMYVLERGKYVPTYIRARAANNRASTKETTIVINSAL